MIGEYSLFLYFLLQMIQIIMLCVLSVSWYSSYTIWTMTDINWSNWSVYYHVQWVTFDTEWRSTKDWYYYWNECKVIN